MTDTKKPFSWAKFTIVAVPVWLLISGGIGLYLHFQVEKKEQQKNDRVFQKAISNSSVADDYQKITAVIGPRHHESAAGIVGLTRMAAMIEGALGASNMGYSITKTAGIEINGYTAPIIRADVLKKDTDKEIWLIVPYDSDPALERGAESAASLAVAFAVAQQLVGQEFTHNVRFLFTPTSPADEEKRLELLAKIQRMITHSNRVGQVVVLGSMSHQSSLHSLCRDPSMPIASLSQELLKPSNGSEACLNEDGETSTILFEMSLPAALICSKNEEPMTAEIADAQQPSATLLSSHAKSLAQILEALGKNK